MTLNSLRLTSRTAHYLRQLFRDDPHRPQYHYLPPGEGPFPAVVNIYGDGWITKPFQSEENIQRVLTFLEQNLK